MGHTIMPDDQEPAAGERKDWVKFWEDHIMCGGTWTYINDPEVPRVICSCGMYGREDIPHLQ